MQTSPSYDLMIACYGVPPIVSMMNTSVTRARHARHRDKIRGKNKLWSPRADDDALQKTDSAIAVIEQGRCNGLHLQSSIVFLSEKTKLDNIEVGFIRLLVNVVDITHF